MTPPPSDAPRMLTIPDVAERLAVSRLQVYRYIKAGRLQVIYLNPPKGSPRIDVRELERFVEAVKRGQTTRHTDAPGTSQE